MEAHAYDVYKFGGDWLLDKKTKLFWFVRSSTQATLSDLMAPNLQPSGEIPSHPPRNPACTIQLSPAGSKPLCGSSRSAAWFPRRTFLTSSKSTAPLRIRASASKPTSSVKIITPQIEE